MTPVGVICGICGSGNIYMETCENQGGRSGHTWVLASECQGCGERRVVADQCPDCAATPANEDQP